MSVQKFMQYKRMTLFCMLIICFLTMAFPMEVNAVEAVEVTLPVEQVFTKKVVRDVSDVFTYDFVSLNNTNPMPSGVTGNAYTFTLTGTSIADIKLTFTIPGIYQYKIEVNSSSFATGYSFTPEAYQITVYVKRTDTGKLVTDIVAEVSQGKKSPGIRFENNYTPLESDPAIMVDPPVKKTVSGNPVRDSTFYFTLTARELSSPMPEGSVDGVKTISITGSGEKDFGTWVYKNEGTYYYDIAEVIFSNTRYTFDKAVYTITDVVEDVEGQLIVTRTVTNQALKPVSSCIFINTFNKAGNDDSSDTSGAGGGGNAEDSRNIVTININEGDVPKDGIDFKWDEMLTGGDVSVSWNIPKVGDDVNIGIYLAMFCLGIICASGCIMYQIFAYRRS